ETPRVNVLFLLAKKKLRESAGENFAARGIDRPPRGVSSKGGMEPPQNSWRHYQVGARTMCACVEAYDEVRPVRSFRLRARQTSRGHPAFRTSAIRRRLLPEPLWPLRFGPPIRRSNFSSSRVASSPPAHRSDRRNVRDRRSRPVFPQGRS